MKLELTPEQIELRKQNAEAYQARLEKIEKLVFDGNTSYSDVMSICNYLKVKAKTINLPNFENHLKEHNKNYSF